MSEAFGSPAEFNFPKLDPALTLEEQSRLQLLDAQVVFLRSAVRLAYSHRAEPMTQLCDDGKKMYSRLSETMGHMKKQHAARRTAVVPVGAAASLLAQLDEGQVRYYDELVQPAEPLHQPLYKAEAEKRIVHVAGSMDLNIQDATLRLYAHRTHFNLRYLFGFALDD